MFKKSPQTKQFNLFHSPSQLMCEREIRLYDDESAWHNKFFRDVTSKIDEEVLKPLYTTERADSRTGRTNAPIRVLIGMMILKEGCGCSDEQLYEECRFNLLYRRALGMINLDEQCPAIDTYYGLRRKICEYEEKHGKNLFDERFKKLTNAQIKEYRISGKAVRMDSKLISSNIAWYSRYEIIHETFLKSVDKDMLQRIEDQLVRQQAMDFFSEDASKTVYRSDSETMNKRLLSLGIVIDWLLSHDEIAPASLLGRVFSEQYEKDGEGTVTVHDKRQISPKSVQNPNDPDAEYRSKNGKKTKGFSVNITETTDEPEKPSVITDVQVKGATAADNGYVEDAVKSTEEVTGQKVETVHADGAYQSPDNRQFAASNSIDLVANGIQGKPSRFDLSMADDGTLEVTDKKTGEQQTAILVRPGSWKIAVKDADGKKTWRYFTQENLERSAVRRKVESIPFEKRKKRNNVEATIFQYCFHTRNNKTRYRTLIKHTMQAIARCAWINMRRLFVFDAEMQLKKA